MDWTERGKIRLFLVFFLQGIHTGRGLHENASESAKDPKDAKTERQFPWNETREHCSSSYGMDHKAFSNINILDLYENLRFDDPADRGEWQLYWKINVDYRKWDRHNKLKVIVLPHSHCDPGWIVTYEEYYERTTRKILNGMLSNLSNNPNLKFIWAEMSFFSLWWNEIDKNDKLKVIKLVENKQLEFVTGGWVMPDEANSHYYSILTQLIEGNQWLQHHLNFTPKNGWSIDPFGVSPTMAYILKRAGFNNMLIQRTHYIIKKHLGNARELEFAWRQEWDSLGTTDILTQLMPFDSYTTPATCGTNKRLCAEFDFKGYYNDIKPSETEAKSMALLDQYQRKGTLFKTSNVLVPLGGDFAWVTQREWTGQSTNYGKIFDFVNSHPELNAQLQFGTLDEYFKSVRADFQRTKTTPSVLTGDFFTYAERDDRYWSGYYTSRPFHKAMDRQLISHLRSAHLAYFLMIGELTKKFEYVDHHPLTKDLFGKLRQASRTLSLFQHHDGITGTSKDRVMEDYASKLFDGLKACNLVMQKSFQVLSHMKNSNLQLSDLQGLNPNADLNANDVFSFDFTPVLTRTHFHGLPKYNWVILSDRNPQSVITVFNPVAQTRTQLVTVHVHTISPQMEIECVDLLGNPYEMEILPVFDSKTKISEDTVQVNFPASLSPFSVKHFVIRYADFPTSSYGRIATKAKIILKNPPAAVKSPIVGTEVFPVSYIDNHSDDEIVISNEHMRVHFDGNGFAKAVTIDGVQHPFKIGMFKYGTEASYGRNSGLYVFMPDGEAKPLGFNRPFVKIVQGKFETYAEVFLDQVRHRITLFNHPGLERFSIEVRNQVDIGHEENFELMMRLQTAIQSGNTSYTDLNGFQMIKRKRLSKIPLAANYFPFPGSTYIEDDNLRMTVLTGQPLGTASLAPGQIEIMMDRTLLQDDQLGVGQGSGESLETINVLKILLETPHCSDIRKEQKAGMLSLVAHRIQHNLLHPFKTFKGEPQKGLSSNSNNRISDYEPTSVGGIACDVIIVDGIPLPTFDEKFNDESYRHSTQTAFLIHRVGFDDTFDKRILNDKCLTEENQLGKIRFADIFPNLLNSRMKQTSINFVKEVTGFQPDDEVEMQHHEIYGFLSQFQQLRRQ